MKSMNWKRLLSAILATVMLLSACAVLSSCADNNTTPPDDNPGTDDPKDPEDTSYKANIPAGTNYSDDPSFVIYAYPEDVFVWKDYDWQNAGTITSDPINDAVFKRSTQVEQELGITIEVFNGAGYADPSELYTAVSAGLDTYDIANVNVNNHISMVQNSYVAEVNSFGNLDLDAPWWDQNLLTDLSICHKNFCLAGDIGTMYKRSISAILFNKELHESNNFDNLYDMVTNKEWTIEVMTDMATAIADDLDGNGERDNQDLYGLIYFTGAISAFVIGSNVQCATKGKDDKPIITISDRCAEVFDAVEPLLYDKLISYNVYTHGENENKMYEMFKANQALFYYGELHSAEDLRSMETNFGILPIPLFDEYQENYRHSVNPNVAAVIVIPMPNNKYEKTSYVLDALGAASKNLLTPAYYTKNLQGRVSRDDESTVSLDVIIGTVAYDTGFLCVKDTNTMLRDLCEKYSIDFSSEYARRADKMDETLDALIETIETLY